MSTSNTLSSPSRPVSVSWATQPSLWLAGAAVLASTVSLHAWLGWRQSALFMVGTFAGIVLYHAAFGFTSSWRVFISDRRGAGLRAQMLMLAIAVALFFPVLARGTLLGRPV